MKIGHDIMQFQVLFLKFYSYSTAINNKKASRLISQSFLISMYYKNDINKQKYVFLHYFQTKSVVR